MQPCAQQPRGLAIVQPQPHMPPARRSCHTPPPPACFCLHVQHVITLCKHECDDTSRYSICTHLLRTATLPFHLCTAVRALCSLYALHTKSHANYQSTLSTPVNLCHSSVMVAHVGKWALLHRFLAACSPVLLAKQAVRDSIHVPPSPAGTDMVCMRLSGHDEDH